MFDGFETHDVEVDGVRVHARVGGSGSPLLLLHGYPHTHVMWHELAPKLARDHTVVVADLRGYGDSGKPAAGADHAEYGKRAMAADVAGLMSALGFDAFAAAGHDRGARVLHRLCLDHPERVTRAAVLDIVPTRHLFGHVDRDFATIYYHWFFLAQAAPLPERLIGGDPEWFLRRTLQQWSAYGEAFEEEVVAEYVRCFSDPAAIAGSCEDYRAGATIDLEHDDASYAAGERVRCPLLVLWGQHGFVGLAYDALAVWHEYAASPELVSGRPLDSGHFLPEEAPGETNAELTAFLSGS